MGVHDSGTGSYWDENSPDVDQPMGLDWQEFQGLKQAINKRLSKGHVAFGDETAGGEHVPGGCAVLGIEISTDGGDATLWIDEDQSAGTFRGHGLAWVWDGLNDARLWCSTAPAESTAATAWTVVKLHPDKQWGGGDVSWTGAHIFCSSVDVTGVLGTNDVSVSGNLKCASNADVTGALNVTSLITCATGASFAHDISGTGADFDSTVVCEAALKITGDASVTGTFVATGDVSITGGTVSMFGSWCERSFNTEYVDICTDGFVVAWGQPTSPPSKMSIVVDNVKLARTTLYVNAYGVPIYSTVSGIISRGSTWCVSLTAALADGAAYWIPFGDNT